MKQVTFFIQLLFAYSLIACNPSGHSVGEIEAEATSIASMDGQTDDYLYGISESGNQVLIWFDSLVNTTWVDVHFRKNDEGQLNVRMTESNDRFEKLTTEYDLVAGDVITFWFTYNDGTPAYDTPEYTYTIGNSDNIDSDSVTSDDVTSDDGNIIDDGGWQIVWEDNFDGTGEIDRTHWNYHIGNGWNPGLDAFQGWGNGEWEWYRPENVYRENGNLVIRADYDDAPTQIEGRDWYQFSGRITTQGLQSWKYGRIEANIALPAKVATWPAFWMMGTTCDATINGAVNGYDIMATNWSSCGEIDIMEHRNTETVVTHNYFWDTRTGLYPWAGESVSENPTKEVWVGDVTQFHLYTIEWDENQIRWYIDRDVNPTPTKAEDITGETLEEFHKEFFIILNLAISGQFTEYATPNKSDFPLYMYVDYVKVWQKG